MQRLLLTVALAGILLLAGRADAGNGDDPIEAVSEPEPEQEPEIERDASAGVDGVE